jgi:HK97 family phage prohead protease
MTALERRLRIARDLEGTVERRTFQAQVELRSFGDAGYDTAELRFTGHAAVFNVSYPIADFQETIAPGSFKRTLAELPDVVLNINHGLGGQLPLARTKSGTLTLIEDAKGLKVDARLDPTDGDVQNLAVKMKRGDVDAMSFAFRATAQTWSDDKSERLIREVMINRADVSIVGMGANPAATGSLRSLSRPSREFVSYLEIAKAKRARLNGWGSGGRLG